MHLPRMPYPSAQPSPAKYRVTIKNVRQLLAADSKMNGGIGYAKPERLQAVVPNRLSRMGRILHRHCLNLLSGSPQSRHLSRSGLQSGTRSSSFQRPSRTTVRPFLPVGDGAYIREDPYHLAVQPHPAGPGCAQPCPQVRVESGGGLLAHTSWQVPDVGNYKYHAKCVTYNLSGVKHQWIRFTVRAAEAGARPALPMPAPSPALTPRPNARPLRGAASMGIVANWAG